MGNSAASGPSLWRHPKSLISEAQNTSECQEQDGKDRKPVVFLSTPLYDPPYDLAWFGFYREDIKERTVHPHYVPVRVFAHPCVRDNAMCPLNVSPLLPGHTHFPAPFHLGRATRNISQWDVSRSDAYHL